MEDIKIEIVEDSIALQYNTISTLETDSNSKPSMVDLKAEFSDFDLFNQSADSSVNLNTYTNNQIGPPDLYLCDVCEVPFSTDTQLANHNEIHREERLPKCNFCELYFKSFERLKGHETLHKIMIQEDNNDAASNSRFSSLYSAPFTLQPNYSSTPPGYLIMIGNASNCSTPTVTSHLISSRGESDSPSINSPLQTGLTSHQNQFTNTLTAETPSEVYGQNHYSSIESQIYNNVRSPSNMEVESGNEFPLATDVNLPKKSSNKLRNVRLSSKKLSKNTTQQVKNDTNQIPSTSVSCSNDNISLPPNHTVTEVPQIDQSSCEVTDERKMPGRRVKIISSDFINKAIPNRIEANDEQRLLTSAGDEHTPLFRIDEVRRLHGEKVGKKNSKSISVRGKLAPNISTQYVCKPCSWQFPSEADINIHKIIHSGVPPLICPICCVGYDNPKHFIHHVRKTTGRKPYKCTQCDMTFLWDRQLVAHISAVHLNSENATEQNALKMALDMNHQDQSHSSESANQTDKGLDTQSVGYKLAHKVALQISIRLGFGKDIKPNAFKAHPTGHFIFENLNEEVAVCVASETSRRLFHHMPTLMPSQKETFRVQTIESSSSCGEIESQRQEETYLNPNQLEQSNSTASSQSLTWNYVGNVPSRQQQFPTTFQGNESNVGIDINPNDFYQCKSCSKKFLTEAELNIHSKIHNQGKEWKCKICGKCLKSQTSFDNHLRRHFRILRYGCESCTERFVSKTQRAYHLNNFHSDQHFVCAICQKKVLGRDRLKSHMKIHDPNRKMYECKQCCKALTSNRGLKDHIERAHGSASKSFRCELCDKYFNIKSNRDEHIKTHTKPVECTQCGRKFAYKKQLENHIKSHNNDRQFCCTECGRKFLTQGNLNEHFKRHSKVNRYFCDICNRGFFDASVCKRHKMVHTKEKPYSCDFCARSFAIRTVLVYHIKCHLNDKRYKCKKCLRRFVFKSNMTAHKCKYEKNSKNSIK